MRSTIALDAKQPEPLRRAAIEILVLDSHAAAAPTWTALLAREQTPARQLAAINVLRQFTAPEVGSVLIERYAGLAPDARKQALDVLIERADRVDALLTALKNKTVPRTDLSAVQSAALRQHADERIRERVTEMLGVANTAKREDVVRTYLPALDAAGDKARGRTIFQSRCAACHLFSGIGLAFGPDLVSFAAGGKEKLLFAILDPNRDVAPDFFFHTIELKDGTSTAGILKNETASAVTLLQVGGVLRPIARDAIATGKVLRQSLMPEGLESGLNTQDMADLIGLLVTPGKLAPPAQECMVMEFTSSDASPPGLSQSACDAARGSPRR